MRGGPYTRTHSSRGKREEEGRRAWAAGFWSGRGPRPPPGWPAARTGISRARAMGLVMVGGEERFRRFRRWPDEMMPLPQEEEEEELVAEDRFAAGSRRCRWAAMAARVLCRRAAAGAAAAGGPAAAAAAAAAGMAAGGADGVGRTPAAADMCAAAGRAAVGAAAVGPGRAGWRIPDFLEGGMGQDGQRKSEAGDRAAPGAEA